MARRMGAYIPKDFVPKKYLKRLTMVATIDMAKKSSNVFSGTPCSIIH